MEWMERLNRTIRYLEEHIMEEISYEELAQIACCSTYHFQRMFAYMAGVPLSEYIRRRKMSLAAAELQTGRDKIIEIGLKYGYNSPTAFNRAFQSVHGVTPSMARKGGVTLKSYPPISFRIMVRGVEELNYRIQDMPAFRILGLAQPLHREVEANFAMVPRMWQKAAEDGTIPRLAAKRNGAPIGLLGVSVCNEKEDWTYFIAVSSSAPAEEPFSEYLVPAATWAVFTGSGTGQSIQGLQQRVVTEWMPASGYEFGHAPDLEVYLSPDPADARYEVWVPITKKSKGD